MWLLPSLCAAAAAAAFPGPMLGSGPAGRNAGSAEGRGSPGRPREETLRGRLSERSGLDPPAAAAAASHRAGPARIGGPAASTPLRQLGGAPPEGRTRARPFPRPGSPRDSSARSRPAPLGRAPR